MASPDLADRWGVATRYLDTSHVEREVPEASVEHLLATLVGDADPWSDPWAGGPLFLPVGSTALPGDVAGHRIVLEDGADGGAADTPPPDLPLGRHRLVGPEGERMLVVHPRRAHDPGDARRWGWAVQLPSIRSAHSWGIGDLADARMLGTWSAARGGDPFVLLSPLHAPVPGPDPEPSPYFASSRCFRSPLALRLGEVEGADLVVLADLAAAGRRLLDDRHIDRAGAWALQRHGLERVWAAGRARFRPAAEAALADDPVAAAHAAFTVAHERHGGPWSTWPPELRHPDGPGWRWLRSDAADRVAFHGWVQLQVEAQLDRLDAEVSVVHDLAVGTSPDGFDAWYWQDLFVLDGTRVGAPPDQFNTQGQDWGLPPLHPWRLRRAGYEPFVRMLRAALAHGSGLRIDHVMGLFRLFWVPPGAGPAAGGYVRQPHDELLALVALESVRSGSVVVGEDLGTVAPGTREALADHGLLGYRVLALGDDAAELPTDALVSVSTHDLPTVVGLWTGSDLADQEAIGTHPNEADTLAARAALRDRIGVADDTDPADVVRAAHRFLAATPCRLAAAQLDDAALVAERPNMPGTVDEWPNWRLAMPRPLEDLLADPLVGDVADILAARDSP